MASRRLTSIVLLLSLFTLSSSHPDNGGIAVYWGQDVREGDLRTTCKSGKYAIVLLAFLNKFGIGMTPALNFAGHCDDAWKPCRMLEPQISFCQVDSVRTQRRSNPRFFRKLFIFSHWLCLCIGYRRKASECSFQSEEPPATHSTRWARRRTQRRWLTISTTASSVAKMVHWEASRSTASTSTSKRRRITGTTLPGNSTSSDKRRGVTFTCRQRLSAPQTQSPISAKPSPPNSSTTSSFSSTTTTLVAPTPVAPTPSWTPGTSGSAWSPPTTRSSWACRQRPAPETVTFRRRFWTRRCFHTRRKPRTTREWCCGIDMAMLRMVTVIAYCRMWLSPSCRCLWRQFPTQFTGPCRRRCAASWFNR